LLKLARGQHLYSAVQGELRTGVSDARLLAALHPTPALGGQPKDAALERIAEWEPFDRGWYAAPVGWVSRTSAEFAVAIRCGLVQPERLALFSGAGIVRGSTAASEWEEIELKIRDFINVLMGE
jgi:menaquinone-specific isochorismate synthase